MSGSPNIADHHAAPTRFKARFLLLRPLIDAAAIFAVLCMIGLTLGTAPTSASPNMPGTALYQSQPPLAAIKAIGEQNDQPVIEIATTSSPASPDAVYRRTSVQAAWGLLMLALSVVAALNLALYRHFRHAYADPRRRNSKG
jgi:hypothetical protein